MDTTGDFPSHSGARQPFLQAFPHQIPQGKKLEAPPVDEKGDAQTRERNSFQSQPYADPILAAIANLTDQMKSMSAVLQDMREMSTKHSATLSAHAKTIHHIASERTQAVPSAPSLFQHPIMRSMDPVSQGSTRETTPQTKGVFPLMPQTPQLFNLPKLPLMPHPFLANPVHAAHVSPGQESSSLMQQSDDSPPVRRQTGVASRKPVNRPDTATNVFSRLSQPKKVPLRDESPRSPAATARSSRSSVRSSGLTSVQSRVRSNSLGNGRSVTPVPSMRGRSRSAAAASRGRLGPVPPPAARSKSPAPAGRPSTPLIRYEVHVAYGDKVLAKAQVATSLTQDGPFLYVVQSELSPSLCFIAPASSPCPFTGLSVSVVGTNARSQRSNVVFKSHSSHVDNPPVNTGDGYFSHSCWLSGPSASVVGGVRMFFKQNGEEVTLYAISLKYWFPEDTDNVIHQAPNFTKDHWKELVRLLGLL